MLSMEVAPSLVFAVRWLEKEAWPGGQLEPPFAGYRGLFVRSARRRPGTLACRGRACLFCRPCLTPKQGALFLFFVFCFFVFLFFVLLFYVF